MRRSAIGRNSNAKKDRTSEGAAKSGKNSVRQIEKNSESSKRDAMWISAPIRF
jgi:hypothetical protein